MRSGTVRVNSKAYYKLHKKRQELEEEIKILEKGLEILNKKC